MQCSSSRVADDVKHSAEPREDEIYNNGIYCITNILLHANCIFRPLKIVR